MNFAEIGGIYTFSGYGRSMQYYTRGWGVGRHYYASLFHWSASSLVHQECHVELDKPIINYIKSDPFQFHQTYELELDKRKVLSRRSS